MEKKKNIKLESENNIHYSPAPNEYIDENFLPHKNWKETREDESLYSLTSIDLNPINFEDEEELSDEEEVDILTHIWDVHLSALEQHKVTSLELMLKEREKRDFEHTLEENCNLDKIKKNDFVTLSKWKKSKKKHTKKSKKSTITNITKRRTLSIVTDIAIVLICFAGAYFSIKEFYLAINRTLTKENEEPIATISFKHNTAQRKLSDRVLWDRLRQESPIYNADIIRTSELSEATITFIDGNEISLYEQTLAQVYFDPEKGTTIDFTGGSITLNTDNSENGMTLVSGDTTVTMGKETNLTATMDPVLDANTVDVSSSSLEVQVSAGEAEFMVAPENLEEEPQTVSLTEGTALEVLPSGTIGEPSLMVQSPENNARYLRQTTNAIPINFAWTDNLEGAKITLQIAKKNDFSEIANTIDVTGINKTEVFLQNGNWYWQIIDDAKNQLANGKFKVINAELPFAITPNNDDVFNYRTEIPTIRFLWVDNDITAEWKFEIADNAEIRNPIIVKNTTQPSSIISSLTAGTWYWRVTPTYTSALTTNEVIAIPVNSFIIQQKSELEPAKLVMPTNKQVVNVQNEQKFTWHYDREAESYTIRISKNKDLSNPKVNESVLGNYFSTTKISEPGIWYWTVTKKDSEGNVSKQSETQSVFALDGILEHYLVNPKNAAFISESKNDSFEFKWKSNIPYESELQISKYSDFSNLLHSVTTETNVVKGLELPVGKWYWRVVTQSKEDGIYYATEPHSIFVDYALATPTIKNPINNYMQILEPDTPSLLISWNAVKKADYYEFKLYHTSNYNKPVYQDLYLDETSIRLNMKSRARGNYYYTIKAVSSSTPSGNMVKSNISKRYFSTTDLSYIKLLDPASGTEIDGVLALLNPNFVTWSCEEEVAYSEFILSKDGEIIMEIENPSTTIKLPQLQAGKWEWRINGTNSDGHDISAQRPSTIIVKDVPLLPTAKNATPAKDAVFDMDYFMNNTSIQFNWDAVPTAEKYTFLLKDSSNNVLISKEMGTETSFIFENIELLDRGTFIWEVEAIRNLPGLEQRGSVLTQSFMIDLPVMEKAQNKTSGDLYGN